MRSTQNDGLALVQENHGGETSCTTLQGDVDALIQSLQARANKLNKKRRTRDDRTHWIVRGRQQALRRVSARLFAIGAAYVSSYSLYLALQEYLACLDKCSIDAEEERHAVGPRNGLPIEQWKAEGEAQELPRIAHMLSRMVQAHTPDSVRHTLSLDGKNLVSLRLGSDEQSLKREADEHAISAQPLQVLEWSRLPADPHAADGLVLVGSESCQEPALSPVRCKTYVPALGPFPILPDEVSESQQAILLNLEDALSRHARVLVNTEHGGVDTAGLLLIFLDRVLQYTPVECVLVLAGSTQLLAHLCQRYRTWVSLEDGIPLSERYAVQYKPTAPLAPDTRICFSSIREMQLMTRSLHEQDAVLCRQTYDLIIVYDLASLTAPWQQVLAYFDAFYRIGFGSPSDPLVASLFDHTVIRPEVSFQKCEGEARFNDHRDEMIVDGQASLSR